MTNILMIEDDAQYAELLGSFLAKYNLNVTNYQDPYLGLSTGINKYELLILDLTLPGMDGIEVCKEVASKMETQTELLPFYQTSTILTSIKRQRESLFPTRDTLCLYSLFTKPLLLVKKKFKSLHESIQKVVKGDLTISFQSKKSDEITQVSNAFDDALRKIEALINSRQLFLRTIMHELKAPIGKGKLLNEFLEDSKQKKSYDMVFERLELLIEEFSIKGSNIKKLKISTPSNSPHQKQISPNNSLSTYRLTDYLKML